jgi:uncharacterized membrane protein YhhN
MKKSLFTYIFAISVIGVFATIILHIKWLDYVFKPLIMISIGGYFILNSEKINKIIVRLAIAAFLFSWFGDIFLMFANRGTIYFMVGLVCFLIAQIFYISLFRQTIQLSGREPFLSGNKIYLIAYILYGATIYYLLFNHLDVVLKIAVFIYMSAILGMSAMALNRLKTVSMASFLFVFVGSVLFLFSDSVIAIDKFYSPIPNDRIFVMSTYIAAQYLIMRGVLKQFVL